VDAPVVSGFQDGKEVWAFARDDGGSVNTVACADVNGDGKAEVM
jgi:hypothetical protein